MPHTMADELALSRTPQEAAVYRGILEPSRLLDKLPVATVSNLEVKQRRWLSIPDVDFRLPNEGFSEGTGKTEVVSHGLAIIGHDIDVDLVFDQETDHIIKPAALYTEQTLTSISYKMVDTFINGDKATSPKGFDGLKKISTGLPGRQVIDAKTFVGGGATTLDLRSGGTSSANRQAFFDALNRLKFVIEGSSPDLYVTNENVLLLIEAMLRREGLFAETRDKFDRTVTTFKGVPIVDAGYKDINGDALILADDHDSPGAGTKTTSIYALKLDARRHVGLLQTKRISVRNLGELQTKPVRRYRIDWTAAIVVWGKRSMARLWNLQIA